MNPRIDLESRRTRRAAQTRQKREAELDQPSVVHQMAQTRQEPEEEEADQTSIAHHMAQTRQEREGELERKLARMKEQGVGDFPTGITCICGHEIIDHATHVRPHQGPPVFGPSAPIEDRVEQFRRFLQHKYDCGECGIMYAAQVIEGKRGYTPREKRPNFGE